MLTATVFLPLVGALVIAALLDGRRARLFAVAVFAVDFLLACIIFGGYDRAEGGLQWVERYAGWVPFLDIQYHLGVDGLSAPLILLTGLLGLAAVFSSWSIQNRLKEYFAALLVLQTAVMGVFAAQDFILFFIFWELELIPMYFLIAIWGSGRREHSAMKFLVFTFVGSAFMLVGILALYFSAGVGTFDMATLAATDFGDLVLPLQVVFAFFLIAFAVKLPVWPLHTWLPDAHTDAPTAVSVMLAGVLLKMGGYGILRVNVGMFPDLAQDAALAIAVLAVINILYGAMVTLRQTDLKRLVAFSSISHMGYVLLGVASIGAAEAVSPIGLTGAAMQMFTHGTITGLLFVGVGLVYDKAHTRHIPRPGRPRGADALRRDRLRRCGHGVPGPSLDQRLRLRGHGLPRHLPRLRRADHPRRGGHPDNGGLHPVDAPAHALRAHAPALGPPRGCQSGRGRGAGASRRRHSRRRYLSGLPHRRILNGGRGDPSPLRIG